MKKKFFPARITVLCLGLFLFQACSSSPSAEVPETQAEDAFPDEWDDPADEAAQAESLPPVAESSPSATESSPPVTESPRLAAAEPPELILPPAPPASPASGGLEIPPGDFPSDAPETTLPPDPQESAAIQPLLPDPPPVEFPPEPDAALAQEPDLPVVPEIALPDPAAQASEVPADSGPVAEAPVQEIPPEPPAESPPRLPPDPPLFLRLPEREIVSPPRENPPAGTARTGSSLPDPPVSHPNLEEERIVFSRIVRALAGQLVEIPFRGAGWVYLGEIGSRQGISYESRRLDPEGQTFVFRAEVPETYILKFYRHDFIRDYAMNDYVQVIVGDAGFSGTNWANPPADQGRITAERWPMTDSPNALVTPPPVVSPVAQGATSTQNAAPVQPSETAAENPEGNFSNAAQADTAVQPIPPQSSPVMAPETYVRRAKDEFDAGNIQPALSILEEMERLYPGMDDEALWLYAQLLEANSPGRDIRLALDTYQRLTEEFPQSPRVPEALQRIAYLQRFYFNIR